MKLVVYFLVVGVCFISLLSCQNNPQIVENQSIKFPKDSVEAVGKHLFQKRCASCHMVNKEMTGPALKGAQGRWVQKTDLYAFIQNSDSVIKVNQYAKDLFIQWNQTVMPPHPDLNYSDIDAILAYVQKMSTP